MPCRNAAPGLNRFASALPAQAAAYAPEATYQAEEVSPIGDTQWHKELVNGITLIGRLGAQPDLRVFSSGSKKAVGRLAVKNVREGESEWCALTAFTYCPPAN